MNKNENDDAAVVSEWKKKREARLQRQQEQSNRSFGDDDNADENEPRNTTSETTTTTRASNVNDDEDDDENNNNDDSNEFITAAKRRKFEQDRIIEERYRKIHGTNERNNKQENDNNERESNIITTKHSSERQDNEPNSDEGKQQRVPDNNDDENDTTEPAQVVNTGRVESLLESVAALQKKHMSETERIMQQRQEEETRILREASKIQKSNLLQAAHDVAQGVLYNDPMRTMWQPPQYIIDQGPDVWQSIRNEWHMQVQGDDIPPPLKRFVDMKLPPPILNCLQSKSINKPTPIQIQGLPVALACRDMVGIAFTGSGKTLTFTIPLVMIALEEELRMPIIAGEGPIGIILAPSRELARQTYDLVNDFCTSISNTPNYPQIRCQLLIGGESVRDQTEIVKTKGIHCVVATPGRLRDILKRRAMNLSICRYICLDEADRMLDMGFDEEVSEIMNYFTHQRQTLLFSATFPRKFQDFARQTLVKPIVVNVGRAGAANLDVIQEVEYVKEDAKIVYLLHCLQKTAPPVIIFCERKGSADDIHEYLLLKGVEAVSIHGGKDQDERNEAIRLFKDGTKDVLIATDVAAKGLDFPAIQHVINFDMPSEIENYVHRIGRTGRAGKTGVATTFINKNCDETTLLDLKALLKEAKQRIPPVLEMLEDPRDAAGNATTGGCSFCGGLGHTIVDCPKIDKDARRVAGSHKDFLASSGGGGDW